MTAPSSRIAPSQRHARQPAAGSGRVACLTAAAYLFTAIGLAAEPEPKAAGRKLLSAADETALAGHLKEALEEGYVMGPRSLQEAQKHLALARRLAPGDPRVDFASGLVLLKQSQVRQAIAQFDASARRDGTPYWPAWQAAIWGHLADKQYEPGLKKLLEFAEMVQNSETTDDVSEAQRDAAHWAGQMIEVLTRCADSKKARNLVSTCQMKILKTFNDELAESLLAGRQSIRQRGLALEEAAGAAQNLADEKKERRKQVKTARLDRDLAGLGKEKQSATKTAEEWKTCLDDVLAKSDKQLGLLERDYRYLDQRAQSLTQSIVLIGREITAMELAASRLNPRTAGPVVMQNAQMQLMQRQNQMLGYQMEYNDAVGRQQQIVEQANLTMQDRAAAVKRYEAATGELVSKNADLDKWTARLQDEKKKLTIQKPAAAGTKRGTADQNPQFTLKSYVPFDFDLERDRLLASFTQSARENTSTAADAVDTK